MPHDLEDSSTTNLLLERSAQGDQEAFGQLFRKYERGLRRLLGYRMGGEFRRRFDASDVMQETQIMAFRRLDEFVRQRPMPFALWLNRTALQRLTDMRRFHRDAAKRSVQREQVGPNRSSVLLSQSQLVSQVTPSGIVSAEEEARRVQLALAELDEADRDVLLMRYVEQFTNREIAYLLDITDAAASRRHGMALLRLRRALARLFPEV